jgi:hypothetical protein
VRFRQRVVLLAQSVEHAGAVDVVVPGHVGADGVQRGGEVEQLLVNRLEPLVDLVEVVLDEFGSRALAVAHHLGLVLEVIEQRHRRHLSVG